MYITSSSTTPKEDENPPAVASLEGSSPSHAGGPGNAVPDRGQAFMRVISATEAAALLRFARTLTLGDVHSAEDLAQETLLRAWQHADRLISTQGLARPWLFTVVRRLAIDGFRARRRRPVELRPLDADLDVDVLPDVGERMLTAHVLKRAMADLAPPHREVLVHRYYLDRGVEDTAAALKLPIGTVKSRTSHALKALRQAVMAQGIHSPQ
ncbi:sigma-70 family RNA polymerase sigma factor [Streptomyces sp. MUM 178J]|uniref:sigma-70 family RNA polymerase sigma factor n=1 Tax=Streptomyces sp. MUM 178J TaxID=2791991 RepID=UPI001F0333CD|nr:sigma-70 family RNA polymerase sigma factor [Streptomyces sp. MUM 178J]WRQ79299.1 sigma-70 family RNA polymerase sigma factor [Streptomyces sp. MUM 178J]